MGKFLIGLIIGLILGSAQGTRSSGRGYQPSIGQNEAPDGERPPPPPDMDSPSGESGVPKKGE